MARVGGASLWRAAVVGGAAALAAPAVISRDRLARLMVQAERMESRGDRGEELAVALASTNRVLAGLARRLAWLPTSQRPWLDTCLYRSVAQCLVLRWYGRDARLALGAGRVGRDDVGAHAWVLYDGPEPVERPAAAFVPFRPSSRERP